MAPLHFFHHPTGQKQAFIRSNRAFASCMLHVALALVLLGMLSACTAALPDLGSNEVRRQKSVDDLIVTLDTLRDPHINQTQTFRVTLISRSGQAIDGADVHLKLDRSDTDLVATPKGQGQYEAVSVYNVTGDWQVTIVAQIDGVERRAKFQVAVSEA